MLISVALLPNLPLSTSSLSAFLDHDIPDFLSPANHFLMKALPQVFLACHTASFLFHGSSRSRSPWFNYSFTLTSSLNDISAWITNYSPSSESHMFTVKRKYQNFPSSVSSWLRPCNNSNNHNKTDELEKTKSIINTCSTA